jgi:ethanolamine utilization protein EutQ
VDEMSEHEGVIKVSADDDLEWYRRFDQDLLLADALTGSDGVAMTVGFVRYGAGESNPWTVSYDEALIVTKGRYTVESRGRSVTAGPGEVIYLRAGTELVYRADEAAEVVYVTYPHWMAATESSPFAERLAEFQPVATADAPR